MYFQARRNIVKPELQLYDIICVLLPMKNYPIFLNVPYMYVLSIYDSLTQGTPIIVLGLWSLDTCY